MKKIIFGTLAVLSLSACGKETVIREVLVTTPTTEVEETTTTKYVAPPTNKFDEYLYDLREFSGQANTMDDAFLIEFGSLVCDAFDSGSSLEDVVEVLAKYSDGNSDDELYAGVVYSAVVNICPEHKSMVDSNL